MKKRTPLVLEIKGNSLDDGPGIRSVVFLKGCPLSCQWCHNPESKKPGVEISFDPVACVGCRTCIDVCDTAAISADNQWFIERSRCSLCLKCTDVCPSGALAGVGREMTAENIVEQVIRDKVFFDTSNGGVTISGGEPTFGINFLGQTVNALKKAGIHILIETCGQFDCKSFTRKVYPFIDQIYYDIKIMDPTAHKKFCGVTNQRILKNFQTLHQAYQEGGIEILPRTPLVPGITDTKENLKAIVRFYKKLHVKKAQLLAYHPMWKEKNVQIGRPPSPQSPGMDTWMSRERTQQCETFFLDAGITLE